MSDELVVQIRIPDGVHSGSKVNVREMFQNSYFIIIISSVL